jgi:hypothetical protein
LFSSLFGFPFDFFGRPIFETPARLARPNADLAKKAILAKKNDESASLGVDQ